MLRIVVTSLALASVLGLLLTTLLILSVTVYQETTPITTVDAVVLSSLDISKNVPKVSLDVSMSLMNPNMVAFKYTNATATLVYKGVVVGEVLIEAGVISKGATKPINATLTVNLGECLQGKSDTLPFNMYTKISGRLFSLLKIFKFHEDVVSTSSCHFNINVCSKTIQEKHCT